MNCRRLALFPFLFSIFAMPPFAAAQATKPATGGSLEDDLRELVATPAISGYESQLAEKIRAKTRASIPRSTISATSSSPSGAARRAG